MTRAEVLSLTRAFLGEHPAWVSVNEDTGGLGLCADASWDLHYWLQARDVASEVLWLDLVANIKNPIQLTRKYPRFRLSDPESSHCVLFVGGYVVDLTARQYDEGLPFPFVWKPGRREAAEERECQASR